MFEIRTFWNNWDKFAVAVHFLGITAAILFFLFVTWFVLIKVVPLNLKKKMELKQQYKEEIETTRNNMISTQRNNNSSQNRIIKQKSFMKSVTH